MKRFKYILRSIFAVLLIILTTTAHAQSKNEQLAWLDSVDISLLTCGPGQEVWSYYGHTALRIEDHEHGTDVAVNWGMFSFTQDYFVLRFVFGLTDYQMGIVPMDNFLAEYASEGRWVKEQHLCLTREEKRKMLMAIGENQQAPTYRYNFFYDNCTTRARDMIIAHIDDGKRYSPNKPTASTYRMEIHKWNKNHRWARFGNDLLLGYMADRPINQEEWEFLPCNLCQEFDTEARRDTADAEKIEPAAPLVKVKSLISLVDKSSYLIKPRAVVSESESITPRMVFLLIAIVICILSGMELLRKKNFWWLDAILFMATGLPGLILLAMVFSQHPTVQANFQILILNPLNVIFTWSVAKRLRKGKMHWYYNIWGLCLVLALGLSLLQDYAEGMGILALALLVRYCTRSTLFVMDKERKEK